MNGFKEIYNDTWVMEDVMVYHHLRRVHFEF